MANKRKTTTAIVAGVTAAALLLGGTFAWTSISQQAKNEAIVDINPGGRLHDDFDGKNKDVYVENFSSGATGVNIYARIRLDQYFEVGQDAGINKTAGDRKVDKVLGENTNINDVTTWVTYKPGDTLGAPIQANDNWQWTLGNDDTNMPYYMPTFNMNKDSLAADINGTYEGKVDGDIVYYDDYVKYGSADEATADSTIVNQVSGEEEYDWDSDTVWENDENNLYDNGGVIYDDTKPIDDGDVYKTTATHTAKQIDSTATVITMQQWIEDYDSQPGPYWVYDTDGWAYWAQPIEPGKTTGLLLDSISLSKVPDDNYYYGINVVGQFATAGDWDMFFAPETSGGAGEDEMTDNAKKLMELITGVAVSEDENTMQKLELTAAGTNTVKINSGDSVSITMDDTGLAEDQTADISDITVSYEDPDADPTEVELTDTQYTYEDNVLTITDTTLAGQTLTVKDKTGVVSGTLTVTAENSGETPPVEAPTYYTMDIAYPLVSGTTVNLGVQDYTAESTEGIQFYIINKANNPGGGSDTELEAKDGMKVVPIVYTYGYGNQIMTETKYYYASPFTNGSAVTTDKAIEGVTFAALDGDTLVAFNSTKVYDATVHTYLGMGTYVYEDPEYGPQETGCMVFESVANPGTYCSVGDANMGVDGDDKFMVTTGVTEASEDVEWDYDVTTITETACTCTTSSTEEPTT